MAAPLKIDSNVTGTRYAEETALKTVDGTVTWYPIEPNSYEDFGGQTTLVPREPIEAGRQRRKGVVTDLDASGGWNTDVTLDNLRDIGQGFFFADRRDKAFADADGTGVDFDDINTSADEYSRLTGDFAADGFAAGDLIFVSGFANSTNNGLKSIATGGVATLGLTVDQNLADETPAANAGRIEVVGFQFADGDLTVDVSGTYPVLVTSSKDCTELGLIPGESIFIGGDTTATEFPDATNNGFCRVRSVTTNAITLDKTQGTMVTDSDTTGLTIQVFFGSVLKNETGTDIVRRTYQLERTLGAPDGASPSQIQAQYLTGSVPNTLSITADTASKLEADLTFVALDDEQLDGPTSLKAGSRPTLVDSDALNTSSDISLIKLAVIDPASANPTALFGFATNVAIEINNNVTPNKALGVLGGFEATAGNFAVSGNIDAYFTDVAAVTAVRANSDVTLEIHYVKSNAGISMDLPLIALGDARVTVEKDEPIKIPLSQDAASGSKIDPTLNHTMLMVFWAYLPDAADS